MQHDCGSKTLKSLPKMPTELPSPADPRVGLRRLGPGLAARRLHSSHSALAVKLLNVSLSDIAVVCSMRLWRLRL